MDMGFKLCWQLNADISKFNESREKEMPLIQEVDTKIKEMRQSISALNKHQMSLKSTFRKKKDATKEMDEKISSAEFALVQSAQENVGLRSKIVQSPDNIIIMKFHKDQDRPINIHVSFNILKDIIRMKHNNSKCQYLKKINKGESYRKKGLARDVHGRREGQKAWLWLGTLDIGLVV
ncbi:hypothetical protein L6452_40752 [Arctium lappa]|uniref:Uncharacterized protein n=1 Tax=Arctium lappa TaxID=4217 RepID=A0ACB8XNN5_ARCLA|nr:hypothetical protein L6452_40752 [Arctium lappa]